MWGWEPRQETVYEYSDDGRLLRSVTVAESEFDAGQVALLVASHRLESEPRGSHGRLMSEVTDPDNQFSYKVHGYTDFAEKAIRDYEDWFKTAHPDANTHGRIYTAELVAKKARKR